MIRFLHAADLHLGLRITRFDEKACSRIGEARFEAIESLRAKAAEHQVHFILIAGDLFDDHSVSRAVAERAFTLFEGRAHNCPVYIIPGNHDPLSPGGVWDREPWQRRQPNKRVHLLRQPAPVDVPGLPVRLFPCPLRNRNSIDDPTAWIAAHPPEPGAHVVRIGLAHGSLNFLPSLPPDDHLIRKDAAEHHRLDYLALGHWHKPLQYPAGGVIRTAYSGTHEPMRFPGSGAGLSTGWSSYAADGDAERFQDEGRGTALLVSIEEPGAPPQIETLEVGRLRWAAERLDVTAQPLGEFFTRYAERDQRELTLLRLSVSGVLDPEKHRRIEEDLRNIVCNRYCPGSSLHTDEVLIEPTAEQLQRIAGDGVLARVLGRLQQDREAGDPNRRRVADHAMKLLYRLAWEEQAS
jgi:DNA repair exonuclease SbcCD nuclease subunit